PSRYWPFRSRFPPMRLPKRATGSPLLALACTSPKKLFIRSGWALFAETAPRCPGLADLTYQGAASVGGLMSMAGDRGPVPDHRNHGDGAQPVNIFAIIAPHNRYAALVRPHLWHVLRRARITSSVRPS